LNIPRKLFIGVTVLFIIIALSLLLFMGSSDERIRGVFISDSVKTLEYLKNNAIVSDEWIRRNEQIFGKNILIINRYIITQIIVPHTLDNFPVKGEKSIIKGTVKKSFYFTRSIGNKNELFIFGLESIWNRNIDNMVVEKLQMSEDGFWVSPDTLLVPAKAKEKFIRIPDIR